MSGLIQMEEYLKVVRERDELKERLAIALQERRQAEHTEAFAEMCSTLGMTATQARILSTLMEAYPAPATLTACLSCIGPSEDRIMRSSNLAVQMHRVRKHFREHGAPGAIINLHNMGFRIDAELHQWISAALNSDAKQQARG